jgi:hypothetical protein
VHDLRLTLSSTRTAFSPRSAKFAVVIASAAVAVAMTTGTPGPARATVTAQPTPQQVARKMLGSFGWARGQYKYLNWLWTAESGWNVSAVNPSTGAYGIPQAVPGAKMATAGPDWRTDAATQIRWGLTYISGSYGSPRAAWLHEAADGWY